MRSIVQVLQQFTGDMPRSGSQRPSPPAAGAVLFSGGLDSAVLLASEARSHDVLPIYVSAGLAWEEAERRVIARLLTHPVFGNRVRPVIEISVPVTDVYPPTHWALQGKAPEYDTPDEDVYLIGRNLLLLSKAGIVCVRHGLARLALGPLAGNPFPDARPAFFDAMAQALSLGLDHPIAIARPFESMHKEEVIVLGASLGVPLELTLSCMSPVGGRHCGACSKCRERQQGFATAGVPDPTMYLTRELRRESG
jgi:7-cyano-7-deazaguanine synthase